MGSPGKTLQARGKKTDRFKNLFKKGKKANCDNDCAPVANPPPRQPSPQASSSHLEQLWNSIPNSEKVKTGGSQAWKLEPSQPKRFAPSEFIGCTIVAIMDGKGVSIAHIPEEDNRCKFLEETGMTDEKMYELASQMASKYDPTDQSVAYILFKPPNGNKTPPGLQEIKDALVEMGMRQENIHTKTYAAAGGAFASTAGPRGKLVVDWTKREGGGNHMALYMQNDQPEYERDFDEDGNQCT